MAWTEPTDVLLVEDDEHVRLATLQSLRLAGLLAHAPGMTALCTPTVNGFGRFRPNALAPQSVLWGRDNRGAMLRVEPVEELVHARLEALVLVHQRVARQHARHALLDFSQFTTY